MSFKEAMLEKAKIEGIYKVEEYLNDINYSESFIQEVLDFIYDFFDK